MPTQKEINCKTGRKIFLLLGKKGRKTTGTEISNYRIGN